MQKTVKIDLRTRTARYIALAQKAKDLVDDAHTPNRRTTRLTALARISANYLHLAAQSHLRELPDQEVSDVIVRFADNAAHATNLLLHDDNVDAYPRIDSRLTICCDGLNNAAVVVEPHNVNQYGFRRLWHEAHDELCTRSSDNAKIINDGLKSFFRETCYAAHPEHPTLRRMRGTLLANTALLDTKLGCVKSGLSAARW